MGLEGRCKEIIVAIQEVLKQFQEIFEEPKDVPPSRPQDHAINLILNAKLISMRPYRYPYFHKNEIEKIVRKLLASGVIQHSQSPFSSSMLLVRKANGIQGLGVYYRGLNAVTIKDKFPIPVVEELMDELHGAVFFSKLDLRSEYHQILVRPEDVHKTAFRTHDGHYEFLVMHFRLTNVPSTFQSLMNKVLQPYLRKFISVFFDNILIYSKIETEHGEYLRVTLETLK